MGQSFEERDVPRTNFTLECEATMVHASTELPSPPAASLPKWNSGTLFATCPTAKGGNGSSFSATLAGGGLMLFCHGNRSERSPESCRTTKTTQQRKLC